MNEREELFGIYNEYIMVRSMIREELKRLDKKFEEVLEI